jgi:hypothetical protein
MRLRWALASLRSSGERSLRGRFREGPAECRDAESEEGKERDEGLTKESAIADERIRGQSLVVREMTAATYVLG